MLIYSCLGKEDSTEAEALEFFIPFERGLWVATLVAEALLLYRLYSEELLGRYRFFATYLALEVVAGTILIQIPYHSVSYAEAYRIYSFLSTLLRLGISWELYGMICEHFPKIGRFRWSLLTALLSLGTLITVAVLRPDLMDQWEYPQTVALVIKRFEDEVLAFFFLLAWIFFRWITTAGPDVFKPNVITHWRLLTILFGVSGAQILAILWFGGGKIVHPLSVLMLLADLGCLVAWSLQMKRAGEIKPGRRYTEQELDEMEAYNQNFIAGLRSLRRAVSQELRESRDRETHPRGKP